MRWWLIFGAALLASQLTYVKGDYDEDDYDASVDEESNDCNEGGENGDSKCKVKEVLKIDTSTDTAASSRPDDNTNINTTNVRRQTDQYNLTANSYEVSFETASNINLEYASPATSYYSSYGIGTEGYIDNNSVNNQRCPEGYSLKNGQCIRNIVRCPAGYALQGDQCRTIGVERLACPQGFELRDNLCYQIGCIITQTPLPPPPVALPQPVPPTTSCPILAPQVVPPPAVIIRFVYL